MKPKVKINEYFKISNVQQKRALDINIEQINEETKEVQVAFASEKAYERWDGKEVVKMDGLDLTRLNNNAPLLFNHNLDAHIGRVVKAWVDTDKIARAIVKFGVNPLALEKWADFKNGDLTKISYMYCPNEIVYVNEDEYFVTKAECFEISFVTIPADDSVGFARSIAKFEEQKIENVVKNIEIKDEKFDNKIEKDLNDNIKKMEKKNMNDYKMLIEMFPQFKEKAAEFMMDGKTADEFRDFIKNETKSAAVQTKTVAQKEEKQEYNVSRFFSSIIKNENSFEKEVSIKIAKEFEKDENERKFYLPLNMLAKQYEAGVAANGGNLVQTNLNGMIDPLRAKLVVAQAGATYLNGLTGDIKLPKMTTGVEPTYIDNEAADAVSTNATFSLIDLVKKTLSDNFIVTRDMMAKSAYDAQSLGLNDALAKIARKMDKDILFGAGTGNSILGVANTSGIGSQATFGAPTYANILGLKAAVEQEDAILNGFSYITNPTINTKLKTTARAGSNNGFICENGQIDGDALYSTTAVPAGTILAGDFSQIVIGNWGVLEILVDPYSLSKRGAVQFTVLVDYGVAVKNPESFIKATGVS